MAWFIGFVKTVENEYPEFGNALTKLNPVEWLVETNGDQENGTFTVTCAVEISEELYNKYISTSNLIS